MKINTTWCLFFLLIAAGMLLPSRSSAQILAYRGDRNPGDCRIIYLVNPTDSIFYVSNPVIAKEDICQTFPLNVEGEHPVLEFSSVNANGSFRLMLPKDTLEYKMLEGPETAASHNAGRFFVRYSNSVIGTYDDRKRNRKIQKLAGGWRTVVIQ